MSKETIVTIAADTALAWTKRAASRLGVPSADAPELAQALVEADLRGVVTHGIVRLPSYAARIETGQMNPVLRWTPLNSYPFGGAYDAGNGIGQVAATRCMKEAIAGAKRTGIGVATVRMSNHAGMLAHYTLLAVQEGLIGIMWTNGSPVMVPSGGRIARISNNPFSMAVPGPDSAPPIVLDVACSTAARGKIYRAAREGLPIPQDWAIDPDGLPTTDPIQALRGAVLPVGGHKGYGLAVMWEILAGVLSGAAIGPRVRSLEDFSGPCDVGHCCFAIDIDRFMPLAQFRERLGEFVTILHETPPISESERVRVPGEASAAERQHRLRSGIPYHSSTIIELDRLAERIGIPRLTWIDSAEVFVS